MKPGPKSKTVAEKAAQGTLRKCRERDTIQFIEPSALPEQPDWLTVEGQEVWQDDISRVNAHMLATEKDSTSFANYCNLQGMIVRCWRTGEAPPVTALAEVRKLQELFGIGGARSRAQKAGGGASAPATNPFLKNGKR